jgi:hypothetical protein
MSVPKGLLRRVAVTAVAAGLAIAAGAVPASAQAGTNYCVNQGHNVYQSASLNSPKAGWVSYYDVWHHYSTNGNWSLGYVRGGGVSGYVPLGILAEDLGNGSNATVCPYH